MLCESLCIWTPLQEVYKCSSAIIRFAAWEPCAGSMRGCCDFPRRFCEQAGLLKQLQEKPSRSHARHMLQARPRRSATLQDEPSSNAHSIQRVAQAQLQAQMPMLFLMCQLWALLGAGTQQLSDKQPSDGRNLHTTCRRCHICRARCCLSRP